MNASFLVTRRGGTWDEAASSHATALTASGLTTLTPDEQVQQMMKDIQSAPRRVREGLINEHSAENLIVALDKLMQAHEYKRESAHKPPGDRDNWGINVQWRRAEEEGLEPKYKLWHKDKNKKRAPKSRYLSPGDIAIRQDPDLMVECDVVRFPNRSPLNHCLIILQCCGYLTDHAVSRAHNWDVPRFLPDVHYEKLDWEKVPLRLWGNQGATVRKVLGDPHHENLDYDRRMPRYVPIDARQFCYTKQNLHEIDRNEARYRAVLDRWERVQHEIETEMSDAEQLRPETKPHIAAHYRPMMTINEGDEDQIDFDTGAEHITNDMDYFRT